MGENTRIEWAKHTFNPWTGCAEVSPACDHCYARTWAKRTGHPERWRGVRDRTSAANWKKPYKWNEEARLAGRRATVFALSLGDIFERHPAVEEARADLWGMIRSTEWLIWLLLTKRPHNITILAPEEWLRDGWPPNVMIGCTIENNATMRQRVASIRTAHDRGCKLPPLFASCEPLLERLDWNDLEPRETSAGTLHVPVADHLGWFRWVICGGESGPGARWMHPDWARALRDDCQRARVPFFFKQWGDVRDDSGGELIRIGKKEAGRLLDGRTHDAMPAWFSRGPR